MVLFPEAGLKLPCKILASSIFWYSHAWSHFREYSSLFQITSCCRAWRLHRSVSSPRAPGLKSNGGSCSPFVHVHYGCITALMRCITPRMCAIRMCHRVAAL